MQKQVVPRFKKGGTPKRRGGLSRALVAVKGTDRDANAIGELYTKACMYLLDSTKNYIACGWALIEKKKSLSHGEWLPWLQKNAVALAMNVTSTPQRLMRVARQYSALSAEYDEAEAVKISRQLWGHAIVSERQKEADYGAIDWDAAALGQYVILLADPPWKYENPPMGGSNRSIENHYRTMTVEELCALQVADLAHDNSLLFMWATAPKLPECLQVMAAWGFNYRTNLVWIKDKIGMGYHARGRHELLLIGKRGQLAPPPPELRPDSVIEAPRGKHSEKPEKAYEIIEAMYPMITRRLELFARVTRDGWASWGNEI